MTTPRIEEMVEEVDSIIANYHGTFMGPNEREDVRQALTQAHQAGIDEAVEKLEHTLLPALFSVQYPPKGDGVVYTFTAKDAERHISNILKALKDNK